MTHAQVAPAQSTSKLALRSSAGGVVVPEMATAVAAAGDRLPSTDTRLRVVIDRVDVDIDGDSFAATSIAVSA
jgi:hypothetical protein